MPCIPESRGPVLRFHVHNIVISVALDGGGHNLARDVGWHTIFSS